MARSADLFTGLLPFFHAAEEKSFRRAAARLGVTPQAVSKAVIDLEARLGAKLLVRTSRAVSLTPEGARFLERCRAAIASVEAGREGVSQARKAPHGEAHVTVSPILARMLLPALVRLRDRYPELGFRVSVTDRILRLAEEGVDLAVRIGARESSSLVSRLLYRPRWVTVAAPSLLARYGAPSHPDDLARYDCLRFLGPGGRAAPWQFADTPRGPGRDRAVTGSLLVDSGELLLDAAVAGQGIAQVLDFMVGPALRDGRLAEVLTTYAAAGPTVHAVCAPERARTPTTRVLVAALTEHFSRLER